MQAPETLEGVRCRVVHPVFRFLLVAAAVLGMAAAVLVELLFGMPLPWWFYAVVLSALAAAVLQLRPLRQQRRALALLGAAGLGAVVLFATPWTSRKPFLRDLGHIEPGMREEQVREIMAKYIEGTGWRVPEAGRSGRHVELHLTDSLVFRHSTAAEFNSDWGVVRFAGGRVVAVEFMAD